MGSHFPIHFQRIGYRAFVHATECDGIDSPGTPDRQRIVFAVGLSYILNEIRLPICLHSLMGRKNESAAEVFILARDILWRFPRDCAFTDVEPPIPNFRLLCEASCRSNCHCQDDDKKAYTQRCKLATLVG